MSCSSISDVIDQKQEARYSSLRGRTALVTGASSGIGRAIAVALAREGAHIFAVGRSSAGLAETSALAGSQSTVTELRTDLTVEADLNQMIGRLSALPGIDFLVHAAGIIHQRRMEDAAIEEFDAQYATNVRAPYLLTKRLLPTLTATQGQVVFINSRAGLHAARADVGQYAATKHALHAIADSLREELNPKGVRVLSVYVGRTAGPMQERLFREEGRSYRPETLLQPEDIASIVLSTLKLPPTAEVTGISVRPTIKTVL
jgi:NAD(P)-dependent dehydrogenase (short-subunit alcohol dehydrogenase family)